MTKTFAQDQDGKIIKTTPEPVDVEEIKSRTDYAAGAALTNLKNYFEGLDELAAIKKDVPGFDDSLLNQATVDELQALLK